MPPPANPDTRPLPSGWYQHYDPSRKSWYYVQTSVHPPKHSFIHPVELLAPGPSAKEKRHPAAMPTPPPESQGPKLSAAQRLYASAQHSTGNPMISIPDDANTHRAAPTAFNHNPSSSSTPGSQQGVSNTHPRPSGTRTQSQGSIFATTTNPSNYYNTHRSASYPSPHANASSTTPLGNKGPRHIVTKAQPPSLLLGGGFGAVSTAIPALSQTSMTPAQLIAAQAKSLPELPAPVPVNPTYVPSATSPPYYQPSVPAPQEKVKTSPSSPTSPAQPPNVIYPGVADTKQGSGFHVRNPSVSPTAAQQAKRASVSVLKNVGKQIGVATAKFVASNLSTALTGIDVTNLANALTGTTFDFSGLQAVLQAQPNADYAAAIAALQQQQFQQPSPTVDYASLINQIQQLQALAAQQQQQQQQILAMQIATLNQNNALLAGQQQTALGGGAPIALPNAAAYSSPPLQQGPPQGQTQTPAHSTNPFAYSPTSPSFNQHPTAPAVPQNAHQPQAPPLYNPLPVQQPPGPNTTQSPPASFSAPVQPPQSNTLQTLQAQQAAANQQLQNQIQQHQLAAQTQQQAMLAQIQQQSQAAQAQQQAAFAQALQQQQQIQQQQNQALLNSIAAPPPAQGTSFTDLMTTYLNGALGSGVPPADPAGVTEIPPSYSGLMSSLGLGGGTAPGDLSSLDISVDLSSTFGSLDLSGLTSE